MLFLDQGAKGVRDLEPSLIIDSGGVIAPKHGRLLHFVPQKSTAIVENAPTDVNRKIKQVLGLFYFCRAKIWRRRRSAVPPRATMRISGSALKPTLLQRCCVLA
jgi:hypothetical protein